MAALRERTRQHPGPFRPFRPWGLPPGRADDDGPPEPQPPRPARPAPLRGRDAHADLPDLRLPALLRAALRRRAARAMDGRAAWLDRLLGRLRRGQPAREPTSGVKGKWGA